MTQDPPRNREDLAARREKRFLRSRVRGTTGLLLRPANSVSLPAMTDTRTIWLFWDGPCPPYVRLCLDTILHFHPQARLLDRAAFDALWRHDRDLAIDGLALNHLSDYVRAYLLAHHGGLYLDADCILLRPLDPILGMAQVHGFVGYREPQGYMSCNFMAAGADSAVARDHYARVVARLRQDVPLQWLDLASARMNEAIAAHGRDALILPTRSIMPLPWQDSAALAMRRDDAAHEVFLPRESWCVMLANKTIHGDSRTAHFPRMTRRALLIDRSYLGFLLRRGNGLPDLAPTISDPGRYAIGGIGPGGPGVRVGAARE